ncbi:putative rrm domain protein [Golovinomyces cichoracearum]|uniref:Putative rrm domain protein n=1 Tax=Golovinomyces cichoracearum TaxID=62708 RepID=A0A420IEK5_9PEZI|nr:putative rrm domain protein [Golovinomyces cichoracearum]
MLFDEEDAPLLKKWIVKRLENTSDADADVLADYVLALLRHDGDDETVRALCESEIPDFLKEDSVSFVRDVFDALNYKTYLPGTSTRRKRPIPFEPPTGPSALQHGRLEGMMFSGQSSGTKKRSYSDRVDQQIYDRGISSGNHVHDQNKFHKRGASQIVRGSMDTSRGGYTGDRQPNLDIHNFPSQYPGMHEITDSSQKMTTFDPNDPMTAMLAMQALGFPFPGANPFGPMDFSSPNDPSTSSNKRRCRDYDVKGFCARGIMCNFEHGEDSIWGSPQPKILTEEYDPTNSFMTSVDLNGGGIKGKDLDVAGKRSARAGSEGRRKGRSGRGDLRQLNNSSKRGGRSEFSSDRPNFDKTKTAIVVENIPEESFTEEKVREFFSEFGKIVDVSMRLYRHLAIIKYDCWNSANLAYKSPKVIFDNRFVKVYWFEDKELQSKQEVDPTSVSGASNQNITEPPVPEKETSESKVDLEEFSRKQQEAQEAHEEKQKKKMEMEAAKKELEKRQEELLRCQAEEKRKLMECLSAKSGKPISNSDSKEQSSVSGDKTASQTEALRVQLAALEAEAQSLGIDTFVPETTTSWMLRGRGRGRGRGGRGEYRARGAFRGYGRGAHFLPTLNATTRLYNLDNRPKKIGMIGVDFTDPEKDENLKQYLLGIGEYESIDATPTRTTITFKDRRTAESFMFNTTGGEIPSVGQVEMSWITAPLTPVNSQSQSSVNAKNCADTDVSVRGNAPVTATGGTGAGINAVSSFKSDNQHNTNANMDYDVAYENEWGPE